MPEAVVLFFEFVHTLARFAGDVRIIFEFLEVIMALWSVWRQKHH